jgi:hypothetical protein
MFAPIQFNQLAHAAMNGRADDMFALMADGVNMEIQGPYWVCSFKMGLYMKALYPVHIFRVWPASLCVVCIYHVF